MNSLTHEQIESMRLNLKEARVMYDSYLTGAAVDALCDLALRALGDAGAVAEPNVLRLRNGFIERMDGSYEPTYGEYVLKDDYDKLRAYALTRPAPAGEVVREACAKVSVKRLVQYLERNATNTDTSPMWQIACILRTLPQWETFTLDLTALERE